MLELEEVSPDQGFCCGSVLAALYDEEAAYADARLGLFVDALTEAGLRDDLNLFVTSDHGEEFLEHGHWEHGQDLHNELMRVPLVAVGPAVTGSVRSASAVPAGR